MKKRFCSVRSLAVCSLLTLGLQMSFADKAPSYQQQAERNLGMVTGVIKDSHGEIVIGATVKAKGTNNIVVTDIEGKFQLSNIGANDILVVTYIGYDDEEIKVKGRKNITVVLNESANQLSDVVVVGYGTMSKAKVTSSISQVNQEQIADIPVASFEQAIAGMMPGVQISQQSGAPGSGATMKIRGSSSITAGTNPLIVIDGFPTTSDDMSNLNVDDIESIDVLKDASSAAIYGSRGANGVVVITTKKGKQGKAKVGLKAYFGWQSVAQKVDLMDAYEFADFVKVARDNLYFDTNGGSPDDPNDKRPKKSRIPEYLLPYINREPGLINTNWQDEIFRNGPIQSYDVSLSGGSDRFTYYTSIGYINQEGIIAGSDFERISGRINLMGKFNKHISVDVEMNPSYSVKNRVSENNHKNDGIILTAMLANPCARVYNDDGALAFGETLKIGMDNGQAAVENPLALAKSIKDKQKTFSFLGNANLNIRIIDNLNFKSHFGLQYSTYDEDYFRPSYLGKYNAAAPQKSMGQYWGGTTVDWVNENTLTYKLDLGDHFIDMLIGQSSQRNDYASRGMVASDFPSDNITNLSAGIVSEGYTKSTTWTLMSLFARVNYSYKNRYLLTASIRRDGSSRFGKDNRYGTFPSVSVGWRVTEENWMKEQKAISDLKLRASLGKTGNFQISNYGAHALMRTANYSYGGILGNGLTPYSAPNPNIGWEKTSQFNVGFDIAFLNNRLQLLADYYRSTTDGILLDVPVPAISGYTTSLQNLGKVRSNGFEFSIKGDIGNKFKWNPSLNFSTNRTKVLQLGPDQNQILSNVCLTEVGYEIGRYYVYNVLGVFTSEEELAAYPHLSTSKVGSYKYEDVNGDKVINDDDRKAVGSYAPDFTVGFHNSFSYANFDLGIMMNWVQGVEVYNQAKSFTLNEQGWSTPSRELIGNFYTEENPDAKYARPLPTPTDKLYENSSLMVEDGSYLRITDITLGYNFPKKLISGLNLSSLRLYFSAHNPFTFTKYSGYNPEVSNYSNPLTPGIDYGTYPVSKSFVFGLNVKF